MTEPMRNNIKNSVVAKFNFYVNQLPPHDAYLRCLAFAYGVQVGSQDADLTNFTNVLLEEYRMKLIVGA